MSQSSDPRLPVRPRWRRGFGNPLGAKGEIACLLQGGGAYSFSGVSAGSHTVVETDPAGFVSTTPNSVAVSVPTSGAATANFGDRSGPAKLYLPLVAKN